MNETQTTPAADTIKSYVMNVVTKTGKVKMQIEGMKGGLSLYALTRCPANGRCEIIDPETGSVVRAFERKGTDLTTQTVNHI
jgi:hypothetical protein